MTGYAALLLADARLPVGGHTQSAGLEPALLAGLPEADVEQLIADRLGTVVRTEAGTAVVALRVAGTDDVAKVHGAWAARTPSQVVREASVLAGRGYLRLLRHLGGTPPRAPVARPVALGLVAARLGLGPREVARLVAYDDVQAVTAAALKLVPLDPLTTVGWSLAVRGLVEEVVAVTAGLTHPDEVPATAAPLLEVWQHAHPTHPRRLFHA